ncbi:MAG: 2-oxoglutarate and iron-dependent oxygenase domain-containing protein [Acidimicrobiales bacterium]|nr:2-oxoglutarate and iron-dependent oxygenase domain-containing protein [Acidimicrobiales bacterium]
MGEPAILDVDLLAFENGDATQRAAVVDGVTESLRTGFVYVEHDLSVDMIDEVYGQLEAFFTLPQENKDAYVVPGSNGQSGYTGLLVETAAIADVPDWKEMLNWGAPLGAGHPLRAKYPHRYGPPTLPEADLPGINDLLLHFHETIADLQARVLRIIAVGLGVDERFFDDMLVDGATLTRAIHYPAMENAPGEQHVWAGEHADINLITALPRATAAGLQVKVDGSWVDAAPPDGRAIINTGLMLERLTNGVIPPGIHQVVSAPGQQGDRYSVVQFAHPTPWTMLEPIGTCVTPDTPLRYPTISAADALDKVLWEINLVEDGRRVD